MPIALDATYSLGDELSGVGVYSREILYGLAATHRDLSFRWCYRPHRFFRAWREDVPGNARRRLLWDAWRRDGLFHGLNQRMPRVSRARTVCTFHDLFVLTGEYSTPEFRARFTQQAREAAARSELIIAVSAFTASQVVELLGVERSRMRVVHHGVRALPRCEPVPREAIVLHVGAIQTRKNIARLVDAFAALPAEWRLVLAGSAGYGAAEILQRVKSNPRITVTGYVSAAELARLYRRASIFAFPSLDEGFGIPVLEAMAAGVPVVTSDGSALREIANGAALLIDPTDTGQITDALLQLAKNEELRNLYIERGRKHAAGFTWEAAVQNTWEAYKELLA